MVLADWNAYQLDAAQHRRVLGGPEHRCDRTTDVLSARTPPSRSRDVGHCGRLYRAADITTDEIIASAATTTLFRAVRIDGRNYWDGVFADNPPIRQLPDMPWTPPRGEPPDEILEPTAGSVGRFIDSSAG